MVFPIQGLVIRNKMQAKKPIVLTYKNYTVHVFDDTAFKNDVDSPTSYDRIYEPESAKQYQPISQHAIEVFQVNKKIASAILLAASGGTSVTSDSVIVDDDNLVTRCCDTLFSIKLPSLDLNWMLEADTATCFSIHRYQDTYITHGEMSIKRIDREGNILWSYGGADIFVCLYEGNAFQMHDDHIALTDFEGSKYKITYDGVTISYDEKVYQPKPVTQISKKPSKPWWKFW